MSRKVRYQLLAKKIYPLYGNKEKMREREKKRVRRAAYSGHDSCVQYFNYRIGVSKLQNYKIEIQRKSLRIVLTYCGFLDVFMFLLLLFLLLTSQGEN